MMNLSAELIALMNWMITTYHTNSAADEYWFGFVLHHNLYVVPNISFETLSKFFRMECASQNKGGFRKIRIRANVADLEALLPTAILLGSEELLNCQKNNGDALEMIITERFTPEQWVKHDSAAFYERGDVNINGKEVQIKFNQAELTNERILKRHFAA